MDVKAFYFCVTIAVVLNVGAFTRSLNAIKEMASMLENIMVNEPMILNLLEWPTELTSHLPILQNNCANQRIKFALREKRKQTDGWTDGQIDG